MRLEIFKVVTIHVALALLLN